MFWKKEIISEPDKVTSVHANNYGSNKRATHLLPPAAPGSHQIAHTNAVKFHHLLVTLEGNQRTGCLKIVSPKTKARSAMLIYRGRVLGCLYGRKSMNFQFLQEDAHPYALTELASPGNLLDAYELPEPLVLAASSLFHGSILETPVAATSEELFYATVNTIIQSQLPGCIVINNLDDEMLCMVYLSEGNICGVFSARHGWLDSLFQSAVSTFKRERSIKVLAAVLPINGRQIESLGFSLTGLNDVQRRCLLRPQLHAVDSFTIASIQYAAHTDSYDPVPTHNSLRMKQQALYNGRQDVFSVAP